MAKISAKSGIVLIDGYNYSTLVSDYEVQMGVDAVEATGLSEGSHNFVPGQRTARLAANMYWDTATINTVMSSHLSNKIVTLMPEGYTLGAPTLSMPFMQANFNPQGNPSSVITLGQIEFLSYGNNAGVEDGYALTHGTITDTAETTGVLDITDAAATAICAGALHIWTACASDTYVVKIQHSTTLGSGYADLLTFTLDGSAVGSERITAASGTVNKYRRVVATRTGAADDDFGFSVHFWHA
jgi:hypothetical protein